MGIDSRFYELEKRFKEGKVIINSFMSNGHGTAEVEFIQTIQRKGEQVKMELTTRYMENIPHPNFKTKQFERVVKTTLADTSTKEEILAEAKRHQGLVEALVQNDIARHLKESTGN